MLAGRADYTTIEPIEAPWFSPGTSLRSVQEGAPASGPVGIIDEIASGVDSDWDYATFIAEVLVEAKPSLCPSTFSLPTSA